VRHLSSLNMSLIDLEFFPFFSLVFYCVYSRVGMRFTLSVCEAFVVFEYVIDRFGVFFFFSPRVLLCLFSRRNAFHFECV